MNTTEDNSAGLSKGLKPWLIEIEYGPQDAEEWPIVSYHIRAFNFTDAVLYGMQFANEDGIKEILSAKAINGNGKTCNTWFVGSRGYFEIKKQQ